MEKTNKQIKVVSTANNSIIVTLPSKNFRREWIGKDVSVNIDNEVLEELMFDPGFKYMIDQGMLYIDDMATKQELGIEPEDAQEPVNVIVLTDKERRYYLVNLSQKEFEDKVAKLPYEQVRLLADYAIENRISDYDKAKFIKKICGKDIIQAIKLDDNDKEE